jgi:4-amino-4-deoxy-L-arabinose transferase-like glycosyltransferase
MTARARIAHTLLRAYPARWRREYGEELIALLEARPLSFQAVADVIVHGGLQRIRNAEIWQTGGLVLAAWLILGTVFNSVRPFPHWPYILFWQLNFAIVLAIGYLSVSREGKSRFGAAVAAATAALIGITPELLLALAWAAGLVHPTILPLHGTTPLVVGHGITDLCIRKDAQMGPSEMFLAPLLTAPLALIPGALGAFASQFVLAFRAGYGLRKD